MIDRFGHVPDFPTPDYCPSEQTTTTKDTCVGACRRGPGDNNDTFSIYMKKCHASTEDLFRRTEKRRQTAASAAGQRGKKRTNQDRGFRRRAVIFKLGKIGPVVTEGVLDERTAETDDGYATHDDDEGEPLVEMQAALEEEDREDTDEEDECTTRHLEDRDGSVEQADVHQLGTGVAWAWA